MLGVQFPAFQNITVPKDENESSKMQELHTSDTTPHPTVRKSAATLL